LFVKNKLKLLSLLDISISLTLTTVKSAKILLKIWLKVYINSVVLVINFVIFKKAQ